MRSKFLLLAGMLAALFFFYSCGGKNKKTTEEKAGTESSTKETASSGDGMVPAIDLASLKDEPSILDAMQKVVDARLADDKKKKDDPAYAGHYLELTRLYTAVLNASTAFSKTFTDPAKALEFNKKVSAIQDKMYEK